MGGANNQKSPLVLDLNGTGLNLSALSQFSPYFDLTGNGFATKTGWIGSGTGLLCLDRNGDGKITDISELFGSAGGFTDGFAALRALDSNGDGLIDANDPAFAQLRVWVNPEGDGVVHPGELLTLAQLGIASINLNATASTEVINGNSVRLVSTYTLTHGTQRTIADAWFNTSATYTRSDTVPVLSAAVEALPELQGYGMLTDLRSAMMADPTLQSMVQALSDSPSQPPAQLLASVTAIMLEWSKSAGIDPSARGGQFDARELDFLEKYTGIPFLNDSNGYGDPNPLWRASISLREGWAAAEDGIAARLILTTGATLPEFVYNAAADFVLPADTLAASMASLLARLGDVSASNAAQWELALRVADAYRDDSRMGIAAYLTTIATSASSSVAAIASAIAYGLAYSVGTDGSLMISGATENGYLYVGTDVHAIDIEGQNTVAPPPLNNTFVYALGSGSVDITESDYSDVPDNKILFTNDIKPSDIQVCLDYTNLVLTDGRPGDTITVIGQAYGVDFNSNVHSDGIQEVVFADGTTWSLSTLFAMATQGTTGSDRLFGVRGSVFDGKGGNDYEQGAGGGDTFIFNAGYGQLEINEFDLGGEGLNKLMLESGILAQNVIVSSDPYGNVFLTLGTNGDRITLDGMNSSSFSETEYGVDSVVFADGTVWSRQNILSAVTTGTIGDDKLYGGYLSQTFDGHGGNDYEQGYGGSDIFIFNAGYGHLEINESGNGTSSTLRLGAGITPTQLRAAHAGSNLVLVDGVTSDQITLDGELGAANAGLQTIQFADGTTLDRAQILALPKANDLNLNEGTSAADSLIGTSGSETYDGEGAPAGSQDYEQGKGGGDTFVYNPGYGQLELSETDFSGSTNVLQIGGGVTAAQVMVTGDASGNVFIADGTAGDLIKLDGELGSYYSGIQSVTFANGSSLSKAQLTTLAGVKTGTMGADSLSGYAEADTFDGKGAPAGSQDYEQGGGGGDTFIYNPGYGQLEVSETDFSGSSNVLKVGGGLTAAQLTVTGDASGNVFLTDGTAGDLIKLDGELGGYYAGVQSVNFADGSSLSKAQLTAFAGTKTGTAAADSLYGSSNADTFDGKGAPAGSQDYEQGGGGGDTFVYNQGYGQLEVSETDFGSSTNVLQLGAGITPENIGVTVAPGGNDILLTDGTSGDLIRLDGEMGAYYLGVQDLKFLGGAIWSKAQLAALAASGTSGADTITGTSGNDVFDGRGGTDMISGGGGYDTYLYRSGYGALTIDNSTPSGAAASGELDLGAGLTSSNLWFSDQAGNLVIDVLGTSDLITIDGWFGTNPSAQLSVVNAGDGGKLDTQLGQLVQAMATYQGAHPSFNPLTAAAMPVDATLQGATSAAWHH